MSKAPHNETSIIFMDGTEECITGYDTSLFEKGTIQFCWAGKAGGIAVVDTYPLHCIKSMSSTIDVSWKS